MKQKLNLLLFWYYALLKRLIKRPGFLMLLLLIPVLTVIFIKASGEERGFISIAIVNEDQTRESEEIVKRLETDNKIAVVTRVHSQSEAMEEVRSGRVDTAWIILPNLKVRAQKIAAGGEEKLARIYMAEDNTFLRASREKLLAVLYPVMSYELYASKAGELPLDNEYKTPEFLAETYNSFHFDSMVDFGFIDSLQTEPPSDYLIAPLRGLLGAVMLLCGMAAALYFAADERKGTYNSLASEKRALVLYGQSLAALTLCAIFMSAAIALSGSYTTLWRESIMMIAFTAASAGFCSLIAAALRTEQRLAAAIPMVLIAALALCPVFFDFKILKPIQMLLPLYHYLYGINNPYYAVNLLLLAAATALMSFAIYSRKA